MSSGSIADVGTGAAQSIGRYFSVISVVPSSFYVTFVYLLIASGSWKHSPDWSKAFASLGHLGVTGVSLLVFFSIGLGLIIHPIQFAIVQFFEGYWGHRAAAEVLRAQRIQRYRHLWDKLYSKEADASQNLFDPATNMDSGELVRLRSRYEETSRARGALPRTLDEVMPTRLGNVLRRSESLAGSQYGLSALEAVPLLLLIAPEKHVDYVNDQRSLLDLAVRMAFISIVASATAVLFLWPHGLWVLIALIPYALAYVSYRGSIVAAQQYGWALDALIHLDRFTLYEKLHLKAPATTQEERIANARLRKLLFDYGQAEAVVYKHPPTGPEVKAWSE